MGLHLSTRHETFMALALQEAMTAESYGEVPIGAVIVKNNQVIAAGFNQSIMNNDPSAHAEMVAVRNACQFLNNYRLTDCELYVTLEPCMMCAGLLLHSRIKRVIFGAGDSRNGALGSQININELSTFNHKLLITHSILKDECSNLIKNFFKKRRC